MDLDAILALTHADRQAVDHEINRRLRSDVALINQLAGYIIHSGGKRLRPLIVLLASRACGYLGADHIELATIVEFIHTATLLHDDVVDASELRRGQTTANVVWGNEASVLVGDFLYSRAFEMMVEVRNMRIMEILSKATNTIAEGEVMQLLNCHEPDITEDHYLYVIRSKTAKLFEAAAQLGAVISGRDAQIESALADYGMHLGTAFQLIDDVLDYSADSRILGKNIGDDLAEGKPTLPLIHALLNGNARERDLLRLAIREGGLEHIDAVAAAIESTGAIAYTARQAEDEAGRARKALAVIADSPHRQALLDLAHFSVHRNH
ncbi:MAG: octaprenyl diphosphate synthase [Acidiferrobacterales bacterium]